ncbi:hypothetical protein L3X38_032668 [Prunus dulcis]|uniref:Uncharacterized protein n=1 Tax=Prunus dulcis TaxID=3755 RepID=A0AAD4VGN5_PRUDU|nr:hypothetical protein L3X38_032668 [Prunus dulcis]
MSGSYQKAATRLREQVARQQQAMLIIGGKQQLKGCQGNSVGLLVGAVGIHQQLVGPVRVHQRGEDLVPVLLAVDGQEDGDLVLVVGDPVLVQLRLSIQGHSLQLALPGLLLGTLG